MMTKDFGFLILLRFYLLRFLLKAADAIPLKKARKKQCFLKGNLLWDTSYFICIRMIFCKRQPKQPPGKKNLSGSQLRVLFLCFHILCFSCQIKTSPLREIGHCIRWRYFSFVAIPPRIWRSALLTSSTRRTDFANSGSIFSTRSVMSLCTVDLLMPNFFAVSRTVALVWIINWATATARSSI